MNLYELTGFYKELQAMIEDDGVDEQTFIDTLEASGWTDDFNAKADAYIAVIRNIEIAIAGDEGQIARIGEIQKQLKDSKTAKENKVKRLKENLCGAMIATDNRKFKTDNHSFWTQKSQSLVVDGVVPVDYLTVPEPEPDNKKIKDALKNGEKLDFAHLDEKETLRFK